LKDTTSKLKLHSDYALLCLIGHKCSQDKILAPLHREVKIDQKTVKHSPTEKLQDCLLAIMQRVEAVYEINTLLKSDPALCKAFGRARCADQSTIQAAHSACDFTNLAQLQTALKQIFQKHSQNYRHDYTQGPLILHIDLTGLPLGAKDKNRVLIRLDSGYGTTELINHLWAEGYQFVVKLCATSRASKVRTRSRPKPVATRRLS
jgi:hypothetical protein